MIQLRPSPSATFQPACFPGGVFNAATSYISHVKTELTEAEAELQPGRVCLRCGSHRQALASHSVWPELVPLREGLVSNQRHVHQL